MNNNLSFVNPKIALQNADKETAAVAKGRAFGLHCFIEIILKSFSETCLGAECFLAGRWRSGLRTRSYSQTGSWGPSN